MTRTTFWNSKTRLYAFGNTPAFSLAEHVAPEESAAFLQLGSGDARNILYTVYAAALDATKADDARVFDFTTVDIEPAVLARNALLFAMLVEDTTLAHIDKIWSFYYDMKVDSSTIRYLHAQCEKLVEASTTLATWTASPFMRFLRPSTEHTLFELRKLWILFISTRDNPSVYKERLQTGMTETSQSNKGEFFNVLHATGPLWMKAMSFTTDLHKTYWRTGLSVPLPESRMNILDANPTLAFALSKDPFPIHPVAMPCQGFHLAEAFDAHEVPNVQNVYSVVQAQFRSWAGAFARAAAAGRIVVRFCVGDVFHVARAMKTAEDTGIFVAQWNEAPLVLLDEGPRQFASIDASNLGDAYGLLNVLSWTAPLLSTSPHAVIYTETLGLAAGEAPKDFRQTLCGDPSIMALVLGVTLMSYITGSSTISHAHEIMLARSLPKENPLYARSVWQRTLNPTARLHFLAPSDAAVFLHKIYNEMFSSEDAKAFRAAVSSKSLSAIRHVQNVCYVRYSFIFILKAFFSRLSANTDGRLIIKDFVARVETDQQLMLGLNSYQELILHLHVSGLYTSIIPSYQNVDYSVDKSSGPFAGWADTDIGRTVHVALRIPIAQFARIETLPISPLIFTVRAPRGLNWFSTFVILRGHDVLPDGKTFRVANSPEDDVAIVLAQVPSWLLMFAPAETVVALTLRPPTLEGMKVVAALGMHMEVFSANVLDKRHVFFSAQQPIIVNVPLAPLFPSSEVAEPSIDAPALSLTLDSRKEAIANLMLRFDVQGEKAREKWEAKVDVRTIQTSATSGVVETVCGTFRETLDFPLPVDIKNAKLRVARKSFYVEVIVNVVHLPLQPSLGMMHRVQSDRLPNLITQKPQWLDMHCQFAFSDRERSNRERFVNTNNTSGRLPFVEVKDDIFMILMRSAGFHNPVRNFVLSDESMPGDGSFDKVHAVIYVASLRLDCSAHTVVLDAHVLLADSVTKDVIAGGRLALGAINHSSAAAKLWDKMLFSFADRCRTWRHKPSCPQSTDSLCSCGAGADVATFSGPRVLANRATRIVISLPFAPFLLDNVGGHMPNFNAGEITGARIPRFSTHPAQSASNATVVTGQCQRCGNDAHIVCAKCGKAKYCDKNCQRAHAKTHKANCV